MTGSGTTTTTLLRRSARDRTVLVLVCLGQFMVILDSAIVNVALPSIEQDLGFAGSTLAWVVNGYLLTFAGFLLLGGRAADLFGQRRMLILGLTLFSVAGLADGVAWTPEVRSRPGSPRGSARRCWHRRPSPS